MRGVDGFGIPDCPNGVRGSHLAIFPDIATHSSGLLALNARPSNVLRQRWWWLRPLFRDEPQNLLEHWPWDGDLGDLEGNIAADDFRSHPARNSRSKSMPPGPGTPPRATYTKSSASSTTAWTLTATLGH